MSTAEKLRLPDYRDLAIVLPLLLCAGLTLYIAFALQLPCPGCNAKADFIFSPNSEQQVLSLIRSAQKTVDIEIYTFSSEDVLRELAEAESRGVRVRVIIEPRTADYRKDRVFGLLLWLGADARWASMEYNLTHSKFIIIDGSKALVGSINLSESALNKNRETAVLLEGDKVKELSAAFEEDWQMATPDVD